MIKINNIIDFIPAWVLLFFIKMKDGAEKPDPAEPNDLKGYNNTIYGEKTPCGICHFYPIFVKI